MRRLAWFTPLAPVRSGIAAYSAELVPGLAGRFVIDLFVDADRVPVRDRESGLEAAGPSIRVRPAHEFAWRHFCEPYDLVIYQLGNSSCHDYMWAYMVRHPGLVVLHDGQLHQARARALIARGHLDEYRAEVAWSHPGAPSDLADLVISASAGSLYYLWPHVAVPMRSARLVAVHNAGLAESLRERFPGVPVDVVRMGVADPLAPGTGWMVRQRHRIPPDAVVVSAFGAVTPEKRISQALRALAPIAAEQPRVRLLLVGEAVSHYDVAAEAASLGLADRVIVGGFVADADLPAYLDASDLCLCLRWPTSRETSASWLRCIGAGRATLVSDLTNTAEVPALDPRSWRTLPSLAGAREAGLGAGEAAPAGGGARTALPSPSPHGSDNDTTEAHLPSSVVDREPCAVAIDMADEVRSIRAALSRLVRDGELRRRIGQAARRHWERDHTLGAMTADYERVIARALALPAPGREGFPGHLVADGTEWARSLVEPFGVDPFGDNRAGV